MERYMVVKIEGMPEVSFTVYIWTDSDQPGLENLLRLVCDCGWFDEKDVVFYEVSLDHRLDKTR
ncbi:hypothetical protein TSUD_121430 [Trifolium subterraneum]|nr:hypothetical protein TSUD_121430 [Trifolium subterraneum]